MNPKNIAFVLLALLALFPLSACRTVGVVEEEKAYTDQIRWPEEYNPDEARFFVHNAITIDARPRSSGRS